ncbi:hypothetical protein CGCA056_v011926 [Colletotrichum aenigma]|uniref:uncharacterized protein n=1 Tax=Colletotrichum aenigma TaxID=1215731 RepID=UPI001873195D|nr:uncharacterized protein CGCA056_v011926 [Colletotrichum aenigma]KAF5512787.1 hypothetical protein CGCA056_v011926 [Colletotrichum aenigma]
MSIQRTFPEPDPRFYKYHSHASNRDKDTQAMRWVQELYWSMGRCRQSGVTYAEGSWGYTVLRVVYTQESDTLWPIALQKFNRWVTQYIIHLNQLIKNKPNGEINKELARRFILEVVENKALKDLNLPNLSVDTPQQDVQSLTQIFEGWRKEAVGDINFDPRDNTRFCDFLVIDEASLRTLAVLPEETPSLEILSRAERRARHELWAGSFVWLIDSLAVKRFQGFEDADNYNGLMKLSPEDLPDAWFERAGRFSSDFWTFDREEIPEGSGEKWYRQH